MYGSSSRPSTVVELLDRLRRATGDRCGVAVDQGARQLQLTGLGDGWAVDQEGQFDREVDGAVRRPEKWAAVNEGSSSTTADSSGRWKGSVDQGVARRELWSTRGTWW
ncbi:unnamed protein product [Closterium sp. NIES-54]